MDEKRFSKLRFPVQKYGPSEDLSKLDAFRVLFSYPEFDEFGKEDPERLKLRNKLIRYICFLYDPNSDLIDEHQTDLKSRKEAAAVEAGFKRSNQGDGDWPEAIQNIFDFKDSEGVDMILRYLKIINNYTWTEICTLEHELEKYTRKRWESDDKTARDLISTCKTIRANLDDLWKEFTQGDKNLGDKIRLEKITPENQHRLLQLTDVQAN